MFVVNVCDLSMGVNSCFHIDFLSTGCLFKLVTYRSTQMFWFLLYRFFIYKFHESSFWKYLLFSIHKFSVVSVMIVRLSPCFIVLLPFTLVLFYRWNYSLGEYSNRSYYGERHGKTEYYIFTHYSRAILLSFYRFWPHVIWAPKLKDLYAYMWKKKVKFFVNYDKWSQQSRNFHYEALKTV